MIETKLRRCDQGPDEVSQGGGAFGSAGGQLMSCLGDLGVVRAAGEDTEIHFFGDGLRFDERHQAADELSASRPADDRAAVRDEQCLIDRCKKVILPRSG